MKRLWSFVFACVIVFGMLGCGANKNSVYDECLAFVAYGGTGTPKGIYAMSLNSDRAGYGLEKEFPIYRFDQLEDVEWFRSTFPSVPFDQSGRGHASLQATFSACDDAFFEKNSLMLVFVAASSGSFRYGVRDVLCDGESFYIDVERTNDPEVATDNMAYWFILVTVPDAIVDGCTTFGARYAGVKK